MPSKIKLISIFAVVLFGIQFIPVDQSNPPVAAEADIPLNVKSILQRSCYDCHSHETRWPWYSRIAPMSWLVAHDVQEGREHLNFSTWVELPSQEVAENMEEIWEEVSEGEMPLWFYLPLHPEAHLSDKDLALLQTWATSLKPKRTLEDAERP